MAYLQQQFNDALSSIEPSVIDKSNAPEAHRKVRDVLEADATLAGYGISPILIGSYARHVSIRRMKDVDVFVRLPDLPTDVTADAILSHVVKVLRAEYGTDRVERQSRSVKVLFPEYDLDVDAVPARPSGLTDSSWEIPQRSPDNVWVRTHPEKLSELSTEMNANNDSLYVPTVKLLRQTRRTILAKGARPSGFTIEAAVYEAFRSGSAMGSTQAERYSTALASVSAQLTNLADFGVGIPDPSLPGRTIQTNATDEQLKAASEKFAAAAATAKEAFAEEDKGKSAIGFRKLLGTNGDGDIVFSMPPGYDENGQLKAGTITAGAPSVPAGQRTFG